MDAVISGHAGVALILDGGRLASIHVENSEEVIPRQEAEIHLLFNGAKDLQFLADADLEQVRAQLELAGARIDALHLALILLDRELSAETRREAALELNELMDLLEITDFLERVLYAHPLPSSADLSGVLELSFPQAPKVEHLLLALEALQGLFKELVLNRKEGATIDSFLLSSSLRYNLRSIPNCFIILEEWLTYFQQEAPAKNSRPIEDVKSEEILESLGELEKDPAQNLEGFEQTSVTGPISTINEQALEKLPPELQARIRNIKKMYLIPRENGRMSAIPRGDGMDIINNTGDDAKYKVRSSGPQGVNPRPGGGWKNLPKRRRLKHRLDQPGPWRVEFLVQHGEEEIYVSHIAHTANDLVELNGGDGNYDVVVTRAAAG